MQKTKAPLSSLNPVEVWKPWKPDAANPWTLQWAGHLYRRAGFGARWDELQQALKQGPDATVALLLSGGPDPATVDEIFDYAHESRKETDDVTLETLHEFQGLWLNRMLESPHPLRERMTLFWHNHFATSVAKVRKSYLMYQQNALLRKHALGKFGTMLLEMSRDPAMLIWLDSNDNLKGRANENYAREVMELFSLGVGHYTEKDIQEAARAFTGWHTADGKFVFNKAQHDEGTKTVLGQTGNWDGQDVVRIILQQPACARFLARKLYRFFISEGEEPPQELLEPLAEQLRKSDYDIGAAVQTILRSRLFFSDYAYRQRIKSPTEYVLGAIHVLEGRLKAPAIFVSLAQVTDGLGQTLYGPPNVKGWDGGKAWLNSATVLARHNLAWSLVGGEDQNFRDKLDPAGLVQKHSPKEPAKQVAFLLDLLLQGEVNPKGREKLIEFLQAGNPKDAELTKRLRESTHNILLMPEFQLS